VAELLGEQWMRILLALVVGFTSIFVVGHVSGFIVRLIVRPPRWLEIETFRPPGEDTRFVRRLTTLERFTARAYTSVAVVGMAIFIMYVLDLRLYGILAGAGIVGIAVAFGAQALIRDALSGLFILIENPYDIGDFIRLNMIEGEVVGISLRHTTLLGDDGSVHTIPNGAITLTSNYTRDATAHTLVLRVASSVTYERLAAVVDEVAQRMATVPEIADRLVDGPRAGGIVSFRSDSYEVEVRTRLHRSVRRTWPPMLNRQLQQALRDAEIEVL
jgi:small conductance mechanosensitive channel